MFRIDSPGATQDNKFTEGDPSSGARATVVTDEWLNAVQEEISGAIEGDGGVLDKLNSGQLLAVFRNRVVRVPDTTELATRSLPVGLAVQTQGRESSGDGGGELYYVRSTAPIPADGWQVIALANGNYAVRDKPFYVFKAPSDSGFAPDEYKYLFMDPAEYDAENSGGASSVANQFHFFHSGDDVRCEFEAGTGSMAFYIEAGVGKTAFYGWQESATHHWSLGTDPSSNFDLKLATGFGVEGKFAPLLIRKSNGQVQVGANSPGGSGLAPLKVSNTDSNGLGLLIEAGAAGSSYLLDTRIADGTSRFKVLGTGRAEVTADTGAGGAAMKISNPDPASVGLFLEIGDGSGSYIADFRLFDGTPRFRIAQSGAALASLGSASAPAFSFLGDDNTGLFNPGADAVSVSTAGTERVRFNSNGNLLIGTTTDGSGNKTLALGNGTAPASNIAGGIIYVEAGALKYRGSSGTITTLGVA